MIPSFSPLTIMSAKREPRVCAWCDVLSGDLRRAGDLVAPPGTDDDRNAMICPRCRGVEPVPHNASGQRTPSLILSRHGFSVEGTGGGCEAMVHGDERSGGTAYALTYMGDASVPEYMDNPVTVGIYPAGTWYSASEALVTHDFASVTAFLGSDLLIRIRTTGEERERYDLEDAIALFASEWWVRQRYEIADDAWEHDAEGGVLAEPTHGEWRPFDIAGDWLKQEAVCMEDVAAVAALELGGTVIIGGGACAAFIVRRVS